MKYYIYLFVFFLFSCSNHHSLDNVAVKQLPDLGDLTKRMEFYVVSEDSASAYSFIFYYTFCNFIRFVLKTSKLK